MSNNGTLTLIHGDKGGVGKSFVASVLIDSRLASGMKDQLIVVESDTRNPDVARLFLKHVRVENIDLKLHDGWMGLSDLLADNPDKEIVVSLPAGIGHFVECVFRTNPATIPTGKRPPFRHESGHHSDSNPATIPEQSGQCDLRV